MNLTRTKALNEGQKQDLLLLTAACVTYDGATAALPIEEDCIYYLLYNKDTLLSVLCAFFDGTDSYECHALTIPKERKKGYFSTLLKELEEEYGEFDFIFPVNEKCSDAKAALMAMDASLWYQEHIMELTLSGLLECKKNISKASGPVSVTPPPAKRQNGKYIFSKEGLLTGFCFLDFREDHAYFYGFEIKEELRNQGFGTACLRSLFQELFMLPGFKKVVLEVSGPNLPAMALYKKMGFCITESLSYYVY